MDDLVAQAAGKLLSDTDVLQLAKGRCRVVRYEELNRYQTLRDAAGPDGACVCLIEQSEGKGHWVAWFEVDSNTWEWFDSYGCRPDAELEYVSEEYKEQAGEQPAITKLLQNSSADTKMIYNQIALQKLAPGVETCGRWCGLRIRKRHLSLKQFQSLFVKQSLSPDYLVTILTMIIT